jgi:hypothetical protein
MQQGKIMLKTKEMASLTKSWNDQKSRAANVQNNQKNVDLTRSKLMSITQYVTNRFLWANTLNALQQCATNVSSDVQITSLSGSQDHVLTAATVREIPASGDLPARKAVISGGSTEITMLTISGRDFGREEDDNVTKFRDSIAEWPYFREALEKGKGVGVKLAEHRLRVSTELGAGGRVCATFRIECKFVEKKRDEIK